MARSLSIEFPGGHYHVTSRGDRPQRAGPSSPSGHAAQQHRLDLQALCVAAQDVIQGSHVLGTRSLGTGQVQGVTGAQGTRRWKRLSMGGAQHPRAWRRSDAAARVRRWRGRPERLSPKRDRPRQPRVAQGCGGAPWERREVREDGFESAGREGRTVEDGRREGEASGGARSAGCDAGMWERVRPMPGRTRA